MSSYPDRSQRSPRFRTTSRFRLTLVREDPQPYGPTPLACPEDAARFAHQLTVGCDREVMGALFLDCRHRALGHTIAYVGTLNRAAVEARGLLTPALLSNAAAIIVFHTHPSGDPSPSAEDLAFTRRLQEAGEVVGVRLVDHLILGEAPAFVSLAHRGAL